MKKTCFATLIGLGIASVALAQGPGPGHGRPFGGEMRIMGFGAGKPGVVVTGAPFSGKEVTTDTQTLADGTHITHTNTAQFYRDSQGRTRIERTFSGMGPWSGGTPKTEIEIFDPVASVTYMLDPATSTATKMTMPAPPSAAQIAKREAERQAHEASEAISTTSLGTQTIQGVACTGTQTTMTIPVGKMGNDKSITVTTQKWYSPDLQLTLQSKRTDPRVGELDFEFQNLTRAEPDASLFAPPASYTVTTKTGMKRSAEAGFRPPPSN
jgi:hypothetical protein